MGVYEEIKDLKMKVDVVKAIVVSGDGMDTCILPKGSFHNKPEEISGLKVLESELVEFGKIIFVNSKACSYGN